MKMFPSREETLVFAVDQFLKAANTPNNDATKELGVMAAIRNYGNIHDKHVAMSRAIVAVSQARHAMSDTELADPNCAKMKVLQAAVGLLREERANLNKPPEAPAEKEQPPIGEPKEAGFTIGASTPVKIPADADGKPLVAVDPRTNLPVDGANAAGAPAVPSAGTDAPAAASAGTTAAAAAK